MQPLTNALPASGALGRNRAYTLFLLGQTVSFTGSAMASIALPLLVFQATGSVARMGLVTAGLSAGSVIAGAISGGLADRFDRRLLMLSCDALAALLFATIPLVWWLLGKQELLLYLLAPPLGFLAMASSVAGTASLPRLVEPDQLILAISRFQTSYAFAYLVGPLLAGSLIGLMGAPAIMGLNALSYLTSALTLLLIRLRPAGEADGAVRVGAGSGVLAGVRFWLQDARLRWTVLLRLAILCLMGGGLDLVIFRLKHELHQGDVVVGLVWGIASLGALAAGLLTPLLRRRLGFGVCFLGGQALMGISLGILGLNATVPLFLALGIVLTFGDLLAQITSAALLQELTPDALQGRVTASIQALIWVGNALGAAGLTSVAAWLGSTPPVFYGMGLLLLLLSALGCLTPARLAAPERLKAP